MRRILLAGAVALAADMAPATVRQVPDLQHTEVALLREVDHLTAALGARLWPRWRPLTAPFLLRTQSWEYLRRHPAPPTDFRPFYSAALGESLWMRPTPDSAQLHAAFPVGGVMTAVLSTPDSTDHPGHWVLTAAHELVHSYQGTRRLVDSFVGPYRSTNDIRFPFPYSDPALNALWRLEAESVFLR